MEKSNQNKFNPDIEKKFKELLNYREKNVFNSSNHFYNPITETTPSNVKNIKDLVINFENQPNRKNISELIIEKEKERKSQDTSLIIEKKDLNLSISGCQNCTNKTCLKCNKSHLSDFNNLKKNSTKSKLETNDNILDELKNLGIIL